MEGNGNSTLPPDRRLLEAGKKLFALNGFENTTTSAIAREAGTSESQLVKYFGGKEGLLVKIFEDGWSKLNFVYTAASITSSPLESLRVIFELLVKVLTSDRQLRDLMLFEGRRIRGKSPDVLITGGYYRLAQEVTRHLEAILKGSPLDGKIRPHAITSALVGMLESMLRDQAIAERQTGHLDPAPDEIRVMFHLLTGCLMQASAAA